MKKYLAILTMGLTALYSCDENPFVFDNVGGQTLVNFARTSVDLPVVIDATGVAEVPVNVSTVSKSDRTFNLKVQKGTTADPKSYTVGTVTIAAGAYNGVLTINGKDVNVETDPKQLILGFETSGGIVTDGNLTVKVFQICPIKKTAFTGAYKVETITPGFNSKSTYGGDGNIVTLKVGETGTQRVFEANYFEDSRFKRKFQLNFVCNEIVVPYQDHEVGCRGNNVNLSTAPATGDNGKYNPNDDSSFTVNLTDNADSDCGGKPVQASYRFVKQ